MTLTGTSRSHELMQSKSWGFVAAAAKKVSVDQSAQQKGALTRRLRIADEQLHNLLGIVGQELRCALGEIFFLS
jgi:hypothetical protein